MSNHMSACRPVTDSRGWLTNAKCVEAKSGAGTKAAQHAVLHGGSSKKSPLKQSMSV